MSPPPLILHHYAMSPFAEKVRLALGIKKLAWHSVETAPLPPRPLLTPLTGGYRRIPVLQVGADIYCDTNIILPALDRIADGPALYKPQGPGLAAALSFNFERAIWRSAIGVAVHFRDEAPDAFLRDRKDDYLYFDMSKTAMEPEFDANAQRMRAQVAWLADALTDGRRFLEGDTPGALDLGYVHALWFIRNGKPRAEIDATLGLAPILPWLERMADIGHGTPTKMTPEAALAAAQEATPAAASHVTTIGAPGEPKPGSRITVTPDDFARVPVEGTLVAADAHEIIVHRVDDRAGDLHLHFPRAGFDLRAL